MKKIIIYVLLLAFGKTFAQDTKVTITGGAIGGGITALSAIGSTPNANGASITGVTLNLQPASASFGGVVTTGIQTIVGDKILTGVTTVNNLTEYITPQFYGADSTGVVDATIAVQKTIDTASRYNKKVLFNGNYKVSALTVPSNTYIIGVSDSATGLYTVSNSPVLSIRGNNITLKNFIIKGDSTGGASSIQAGVQVDSIPVSTKYNIDIDGVRFKGLNRGFYGYKNGFSGGGVRLHNCYFDSCSIGIFTDVQSEYNHFTNNFINVCGIGIKNAGGNNSFSASVLQSNNVGVYIIGGGANDGHSIMTGCTINSSVTYCVYALNNSAGNGYTFADCVLMGSAGAPVLITNCTLIRFIACDFATQTTITINGAADNNEFIANKFLTKPTISWVATHVKWLLNSWYGGIPDGIPVGGLDLNVTMPTTPSTFTKAIDWAITGAGSASQITNVLNCEYKAGYTGGSRTMSGRFINSSAGTATDIFSANSNLAVYASSGATTTGTNVGVFSNPASGNVNYSFFGLDVTTKNSGTNIGVASFALNTGTSPIELAGYFGLQNSLPTYTSAALMADNGSEAQPIFVARDNGTVKFSIVDGGNPTLALGNRLIIGEGTDGSAGQTTLVAGTKAITITGITTSSRALVQLVTPSGVALTTAYQAVCTANTLTIQANVAAGTINVNDISVINYFIIN